MATSVVGLRYVTGGKFVFIQQDFVSYADTVKNVNNQFFRRGIPAPAVILVGLPKHEVKDES